MTLSPDDARFRAALARGLRLGGRLALEALGRMKEAVEAYRKAHSLAEWSSEVTARLAALGVTP